MDMYGTLYVHKTLSSIYGICINTDQVLDYKITVSYTEESIHIVYGLITK